VAIHNNMNEGTWKEVLAWESLHEPPSDVNPDDAKPTLLRFTGRPDENSPKAYLKQLFGCPAPFDRHDWIVDRAGRQVRYIIDYYHDPAGVDTDGRPTLHDSKAIQSIKIDVRPALDSFEAFADRAFRMPLKAATGLGYQYLPLHLPRDKAGAPKYGPNMANAGGASGGGAGVSAEAAARSAGGMMAALFDALSSRNSGAPALADSPAKPTTPEMAELSATAKALSEQCGPCTAKLAACEAEADCRNASIALTLCMARTLCADQVRTEEGIGSGHVDLVVDSSTR
jgi:hypothetical protein